MISATVD